MIDKNKSEKVRSLIEANLNLIDMIIQQLDYANLSMAKREGLRQEGALALKKAAENYVEGQGVSFRIVAKALIKANMERYIRELSVPNPTIKQKTIIEISTRRNE